MTYDEFNYYVFKENREGLFFPSMGGSMVKTYLKKGFDYPVQLDFYPKNVEKINSVKGIKLIFAIKTSQYIIRKCR